jgi:tetratricopeptide (TPR) repeat protein
MLLQPKDRDVRFLRARMHFFFACQAASQSDAAVERTNLDQAIEQEPTDLDVLIALYRVKDDNPARREKVMKLIKTVVDTCRNEIEDIPDEPVNYNELAWLVANTEGDFDEAIRFSQKSVELARAEATTTSDFKHVGQYLDTLAHCYFAKKDYANAVKYQAEAVKLDPHTKAISRQYQVFRDALANSQGQSK